MPEQLALPLPSSPACPHCGGPVAVAGRRAWCLKPYAEGGCGAHWPRWPYKTREPAAPKDDRLSVVSGDERQGRIELPRFKIDSW